MYQVNHPTLPLHLSWSIGSKSGKLRKTGSASSNGPSLDASQSSESRKDREVSNTLEQFLEDSNSLSERERLTVAEKLGDSLETSALEDLVSYFTDVLEHRNCVNEV